ncbi:MULTISPECIES: hypothetical protein [Staphylococcus]|nr:MULTISPECIES: hypothetical protein [Staphylococcus]MBM6506257.1 hypothetical protein [Staphylococcus pasteuri]PTU81911.1 hypothetical protein BUZ66_08270 [Staphylococcus pasteuri]QQT19677.1 hypothetical protein I6J08_08725 [Staphylococcus pasteuri]RIO37008.1 hypothetical protein BUZ65_03890 [Staphylococcus pasteuri]RIO39346.1 hypothetical protein BUZ63_08090 [Staphylococcus pasteuri]
MKIKYLAVPSLAITLLLTGCGQKDSDNNKEAKDKQEEKKKDSKKEKSKDKTTNNSTENNSNESTQQNNSTQEASNNSNNQQETQAEANERMQNESRSEHNGMSNAEYAEKVSNDANSNSKEYQDYLNAKESQHAVTHLTPEQKANGAGGGGAAWNYADEDESFNDWKERTDSEKAQAGY